MVESFSKGQVYYFNTVSGVTSGEKIPPGIQGKEPLTVNYMEQNMRIPTPPTRYPRNMPRERNIITNAYPVRGGLLNKAIEVYQVTFDPPIPTNEVRKRSLAVFGHEKKKQHENRSLLMETFGDFEFDNLKIWRFFPRRCFSGSLLLNMCELPGDPSRSDPVLLCERYLLDCGSPWDD